MTIVHRQSQCSATAKRTRKPEYILVKKVRSELLKIYIFCTHNYRISDIENELYSEITEVPEVDRPTPITFGSANLTTPCSLSSSFSIRAMVDAK